MKYIILKCKNYDCKAEFLVGINDWYIKEYERKIHDYFICPICESLVFTEKDNNCIVKFVLP